MPDTNRAMVSRPMRVPILNKFSCAGSKPVPAVGIPNFQYGSWHRLPFCHKHYQTRIVFFNNAQQGNRSVFDRHLYRKTAACFSVINTKRLYLDLSLRDGNMPWPVMSHEDQ